MRARVEIVKGEPLEKCCDEENVDHEEDDEQQEGARGLKWRMIVLPNSR